MKEVEPYSETPDIIPFASPFKSELLTQAELDALKRGTLRLLDEVGVHFPSRGALEIFADHGARVDVDRGIVRIPPDLVEKAMSTAPRSFVLGGREGRFDLILDGSCSYLCTDGPACTRLTWRHGRCVPRENRTWPGWRGCATRCH